MVMVIVIVMMMTMKILERIKHMTKIVAMKMILLIHDKIVYIYIHVVSFQQGQHMNFWITTYDNI